MIVDCGLYERGQRNAEALALEQVVARGRRDPDTSVWIGPFEPADDEFAEVREAFDLHALAVEDGRTCAGSWRRTGRCCSTAPERSSTR